MKTLEFKVNLRRSVEVHRLWIVAHPTRGIWQGLGNSPREAWENTLNLIIGDDSCTLEQFKQCMGVLRRHGWRARRCNVTVEERHVRDHDTPN